MNTDEKLTNITEDLKAFTETITSMMDQTKNSELSPSQKDTSNPLYPITAVPDNRRAPPMDGRHYTKIGGMWNLKHEISSPKFYELLIKTELKGDTDMGIKNFYNHIKICLNALNRPQKDLFPGYQYIKRHSEFAEYFIQDHDHPSYSCNVQIHTSLIHSLLVAISNETCVKSFMAHQA